MRPGEELKEIRARAGITTREVEAFSKTIADAEGNQEFLMSNAWLAQIENEEKALPSIYKFFTLASIYGVSYTELLAFYGVDTKKVKKYHAELPIAKTRSEEHTSELQSQSNL